MAAALEPDLQLTGLTAGYDGHPVLDVPELSIAKGEFLSILGPSGCGKTTLLNCLAGFVHPTSGRIDLGGRDITGVPAYKRGLGMVFQNYALFPHMSVADNVAYGLKVRKVGKLEREERVAEALRLVGLEEYAHRRPRQMSGGQQQRVAVARALAIRPAVLLLDEPLSNLDAKLRREMRVELRTLQQRIGTTTVFVTHDQEEALSMSDRIAVMNGGRIEQLGTPHEIYRQPATRFVAEFIGAANVLDAHTAPGLVPDTAAVVAVRPERVRIGPTGQGRLTGTVTYRAFVGDAWQLRISLKSGETLSAEVPDVATSAGDPPEVGATVGVWWDPGDVIPLSDGRDPR
ncbi:ABC transporter ATP-binding protein [Actinopolymorpha pittospori]